MVNTPYSFYYSKTRFKKTEFEKDLPKRMIFPFYGETMESVRNSLKIELDKKDDDDRTVKMQWKLTFQGKHKSYE